MSLKASAAPAPDEETIPIYDISGEKPVLGDIPHSQVHDAIASGKFSFPKGQKVTVVAPDGTHGTIEADQAPDAFNNGYKYATPSLQAAQAEKDEFGTGKQQALAAVEGAAQGLAGPLAPMIERGLGVNPENIRKRAEINPWTHGVSEAAGFVGGLFTGASEAALVGRAGEAVATAAKLGGEGAGIASRIAAGGAKAATEMGLIQAGDETTKLITEDPNQSVGSAAINVGLSGLLGLGGGAAATGLGMAVKGGIKATGLDGALKEFTDRLAYRGANLNPNEAMQHELSSAMDIYHDMGSEIGGANGLKSQALLKSMPGSVTPEITEQISQVASKADVALSKMVEEGVPERLIKKFQSHFNQFMETATDPAATVGEHFDALNEFKGKLQNYAKGNWGPFSVKPTDEAYDFINIAKNLSHDVRVSLENPDVWGKSVADVQKNLNKAWVDAIPAVKDAESKFMSAVGNERVVDPAKFNTYSNQNGKATSETIRQQMMGNFVKAMDKFQTAVDDIYQKAGVPNPHPPIGMSALKESLEKKSPWAKVADLYYDRALSSAAGMGIGATVGGAAGHATMIPGAGLAGTLLGGKLGEKILPAIIQPLMTKSLNSGALQQAVKFSENVIKGNSALLKTTKDVFVGAAKTVPQHFMPTRESIEKLNKSLEYAQNSPASLFEVGGDLGHYLPDHQTAVAQHAQSAVNYLNSLRPQSIQAGPLDTKLAPPKDQQAKFERALAIAEQPLLALQHLKQNRLLPQDVATLKTVYPGLYPKMVQELTNHMAEHVSKGGTIPYRLRQSLSLFVGQPLDSTMTPASIQAIQSTFANKPAPQSQGQQGPAPKKSTAKLNKIATDMQTQGQSRELRAHKI